MVEIATDSDFLQIVYNAYEEGTVHAVDQTLAQDAVYYWRVRANKSCRNRPLLVPGSISRSEIIPNSFRKRNHKIEARQMAGWALAVRDNS